jgi:hypothetical protein
MFLACTLAFGNEYQDAIRCQAQQDVEVRNVQFGIAEDQDQPMKTLFVVFVLALGTLAFVAPGVSAAASKLTMEQQHIIVEYLRSEKIPSQSAASLTPRAAVPASVKLTPIPPQLGEKVPQIAQHLFFVTDSEIVLVSEGEVADVKFNKAKN